MYPAKSIDKYGITGIFQALCKLQRPFQAPSVRPEVGKQCSKIISDCEQVRIYCQNFLVGSNCFFIFAFVLVCGTQQQG